MMDIVERLRNIDCDHEPFTPAHKDCICLMTNEAANEIDDLRADVKAVIIDERERCCTIIHGFCSSDNEAQRIVDAIRGKK
jgi:3-deoxy-D-arabino-heptulosonate 7-phosphate (DAHP) synthase